VKLGDLDLGRYFSTSKAQTNSSVGTPFYMSPECMRGDQCDAPPLFLPRVLCCIYDACVACRYSFSSDVWSLGCVVYEMCVGRPPFFKENANNFYQVWAVKLWD
jgi:serine/threonine protein kinase